MSTRVIQLDIFQTGFRDDNDAPVIGGSVEFYTADQTYTTPKNGYTTKLKDATLTSVTLDANGAYPNGLFFDGGTVYDFRLKDSAGATVRNYINAKIPNNTENLKTVTTDYTATIDDDVILCDTTSNAITITLYPVEDSVVSITIKNIGSALNSVTIDGDGTDLINGNLTSSLVDGAAQQYFSDLSQWFGAATTTGTAYTSDNLVGGAGITFTAGGGQTSVAVDVTDSNISASETQKGVVERATDAEVTAATDTERYTTSAQAALMTVKAATDPSATVVSASQAEQEAATSTDVAVTPSVQQYHPSACKAWVIGTAPTIDASYNVSSMVNVGVGNYTVNFATNFSSVNFATLVTPLNVAYRTAQISAQAVGSVQVNVYNSAFTAAGSTISLSCFGDQ